MCIQIGDALRVGLMGCEPGRDQWGIRFTFFGKRLRFCLVVRGFDGCLLVNAIGATRPMNCGRVWRILPRRIRVLRSVDLKHITHTSITHTTHNTHRYHTQHRVGGPNGKMGHFGLAGFRTRNPTKMVRGVLWHVPTCRKCIPDAFRENVFLWQKIGFWVQIALFGCSA